MALNIQPEDMKGVFRKSKEPLEMLSIGGATTGAKMAEPKTAFTALPFTTMPARAPIPAQPPIQTQPGIPAAATAGAKTATQKLGGALPIQPGGTPTQTTAPKTIDVAPVAGPVKTTTPTQSITAAPITTAPVKTTTPATVAVASPAGPVKTTEPPKTTGTGTVDVAPPQSPLMSVATTGTAPGTVNPLVDSLTTFENQAKNWAAGVDDPIFRVAANNLINQVGLMNQAQQDALRMQINSDPALRGQGAGLALMHMMTRDQSFKVDDLIGQMSEESKKRVLDMQKYGFEAGLKINDERRSRMVEDVKTLISAGSFDDAASVMNRVMGQDVGGTGFHVTAEDLRSRDNHSLDQFQSRMELVTSMAKTNPALAAAMLQPLMDDPAFKGWFPDGAKAEDFIASLTDVNRIANLQQGSEMNGEINAIAAAGQDYAEVAGMLPEYFRLMGRNAIREGQRLSLEQVNAIRGADGLSAFTKDPQTGELLDENGLPLDEADYTELAYRQEYFERTEKANTQPWETFRDTLLKSPYSAKFMDESLFPSGRDALAKVLETYFIDPANFKVDPVTGQMIPDMSKMQLPWNDPKYYQIYYTWPTAAFDATGKTIGKYDLGGDVYGDTDANGNEIRSTPADEALDSQFATYARQDGNMTAQEWYFATAGGTMPADPNRIPTEVKTTGSSGTLVPEDSLAFENMTTQQKTDLLSDPIRAKKMIDDGLLQSITNVANIPTTNEAVTALSQTNGGWIAINGKPLHIDHFQNGLIFFKDPSGAEYQMTTGIGGTVMGKPVKPGDITYKKPDGTWITISFDKLGV